MKRKMNHDFIEKTGIYVNIKNKNATAIEGE